MYFTENDFRTMVYELIEKKPSSYGKLCEIVKNTVEKSVQWWCVSAGFKDPDVANEIMQDLYLKFMLVTIPNFLKKDRDDGSVNYNPDGFRAWMFEVAKNFTRTKISKMYRESNGKDEIEDDDAVTIEAFDFPVDKKKETLQRCMDRVLGYDAQIYATLSWLAQFVFVLSYDISRIEANNRLEDEFGSKSLSLLYDMVLFEAKYIPWLELTPAQKKRIEAALRKPWKDGRAYGDVTYAEYSMNKGLKASISDWVNKFNKKLKGEKKKDESLDD